MARNFGNLLSKLLKQRSFRLEKISPATFPNDVIATYHRRGERITKKESDAIIALVRTGTAFRCRIGNGRYAYGQTVSNAIEVAVKKMEKSPKRKLKKEAT